MQMFWGHPRHLTPLKDVMTSFLHSGSMNTAGQAIFGQGLRSCPGLGPRTSGQQTAKFLPRLHLNPLGQLCLSQLTALPPSWNGFPERQGLFLKQQGPGSSAGPNKQTKPAAHCWLPMKLVHSPCWFNWRPNRQGIGDWGMGGNGPGLGSGKGSIIGVTGPPRRRCGSKKKNEKYK